MLRTSLITYTSFFRYCGAAAMQLNASFMVEVARTYKATKTGRYGQ